MLTKWRAGVSGTLEWYYCICPREVWLIVHQINPESKRYPTPALTPYPRTIPTTRA
ncbi:MAG: Dna2/Cas4 domain-containing protein [Bacillota bacterium]